MKPVLCSLVAFGCALALSAVALADDTSESSELASLIKFVDDAADQIRDRGDAAFAEFRNADGKWYRGDRYVFVDDLQGTILVCPPQPSLEGRSESELKNADGRQSIALIQAAVDNEQGAGWAHYRWPRPGQEKPVWKSSYVVRTAGPDGKQYLVGSGIYPKRVYREFVVDTVERAAKFIADKGSASFATLSDKTGPFFYQDTYVFVFDESGKELVNPAFGGSLGRDALEVADIDGSYPAQKMFDLLKIADFGWVDYKWPRPGQTRAVPKSAYVRKVQTAEGTFVVGAGLYQD